MLYKVVFKNAKGKMDAVFFADETLANEYAVLRNGIIEFVPIKTTRFW